MNLGLKLFRYIAFLNIPLMIIGMFFLYEPLFHAPSLAAYKEGVSKAFIFIGFGMTFTSLRDVKKIDKFGRYFLERPKLFKPYYYISLLIGLLSTFIGIILMFYDAHLQLGVGVTSFGVGYVSLIKSLADQAKKEYHS